MKPGHRRHFFTGAAVGAATLCRISQARSVLETRSVAVIGHTGHGDYGHGLDTMWLNIPTVRLVGVADANEQGLETARRRLANVDGFVRYQDLLDRARPDMVAIAPRHIDQHADMCLAAIGAGVRGIYIEKPFCRTPDEADAVISACRDHRVKLAVAHRNRFHPVFERVRSLVRSGAIGQLYEIRGRGKEDNRGGCEDLWVLGSHLINLALAIAGPAKSCSAVIYQGDRPCTSMDLREGREGIGRIAGNRVHARYELANGIPFFFDSIQGQGNRDAGFGLRLLGTEGSIDLRIDQNPFARMCRGNPNLLTTQPIAWEILSCDPADSNGEGGTVEDLAAIHDRVATHRYAAEDLIAAIDSDRRTRCDEVDGREIVEMICAVFASHRLNGASVSLPLVDRAHPFAND